MSNTELNLDHRPVDDLFPEASRVESMAGNRCASPPIGCGGPALAFSDQLSAKEYGITSLCQKCQDIVFKEDDEDEEERQRLEMEEHYRTVLIPV